MKKAYLFFYLLIIESAFCFAQQNALHRNFSSAFKQPNNVEAISIDCMHDNELRTDACDSLPINIDIFRNLKTLYISESKIKSLPVTINKLSRLRKLSLGYLYFFNYDTELCKLVGLDSLEELGLWMGGVKMLPLCITDLKSLRKIDLSFNKSLNIENVFKVFQKLPALECIDLSGIDSLQVLPLEVSKLKSLQCIHLNWFRKDLNYAESIDRLSELNLKVLSLTDNMLNDLPESILKLTELEEINLSQNNFKVLPEKILTLTNLKYVNIQRNNYSLEQITEDVNRLIKLEKINLGGNPKLNSQEAIINLSKLPALKYVDLFMCSLDTIPNELRNFIALESLDVSTNPNIDLVTLLRLLADVKTLKTLNISDNKLKTLPDEISLLTQLEHLIIGRNELLSLPDSFFKLNNLKSLNIHGCYISESEILNIKKRLPNCIITNEWVYRN